MMGLLKMMTKKTPRPHDSKNEDTDDDDAASARKTQ
jgi:hypothetical protein